MRFFCSPAEKNKRAEEPSSARLFSSGEEAGPVFVDDVPPGRARPGPPYWTPLRGEAAYHRKRGRAAPDTQN